MFENFWGNAHVTDALERMIEQDRIAQTLLFAGPEGIGKATLARRFGAKLLGGPKKSNKMILVCLTTWRLSRAGRSGRPRNATKIRSYSLRTPILSASRRTARCGSFPFRKCAS